jgi:predicted dehydrogenase
MIGLGSIGIQHTRNLALVLREINEPFQIDALRMKRRPLPGDINALISETYSSFDALPSDYDVVFINTPTCLHFDHLQKVIGCTLHVFIEKPVFDQPDYLWQKLPFRANGVYYVACPLRYHTVIQYVKDIIDKSRIFSARCICSSYLPEWRPGTDYRECYSAKADQGGGVRIDLIHEWDYLRYLFGTPSSMRQFYGTFSNLDITSEDLAIYIARYPNKLVSLHLDYFGRVKRREIELFTEDEVIIGDLYSQAVRFVKEGRVLPLPQSREEMQCAELHAFISMTNGEVENHNTIANAIETLRLAAGDEGL